jgi:hypothetical protein
MTERATFPVQRVTMFTATAIPSRQPYWFRVDDVVSRVARAEQGSRVL